MKKIIFAFILSFTVLGLVACDDDDTLRVAMDLIYPPFETVDPNNKPEGISVDIADAFGEYLGRDVEIVNTDFLSIIPALRSGEVDIAIASMSITEDRKTSVDFSNPYFYFKIISLLNKDFATENELDEDSTIEDLLEIDDVNYIGIVSQVSTSIPESYGKDVIAATDLGTAVESVAQGTADVLLMSANPVLDGYNANPDTTMVLWDPFVSSPIGMATNKGNSELIAEANAFIDTFDDDGGLYELLKARWDDVLFERLGRYGLDFYINE